MNSEINISSILKRINTTPEKKEGVKIKDTDLAALWEAIGKAHFPGFILNDNAKRIMMSYFTPSEKGVMFMGHVGVGKTLNSLIFQEVRRALNAPPVFNVSVKSFEDNYKLHGQDYYSEIKLQKVLILHDIGLESPDFGDFGQKRNLIQDLLFERYDLWQKAKLKTHVTTNLDGPALAKIYDSRLIDRFREMFNFVSVTGESLRK